MCHIYAEKLVSDVSFQLLKSYNTQKPEETFYCRNMLITGCYNLQSLAFSTTPSWTRITSGKGKVIQTKIFVDSPFRPLLRVAFLSFCSRKGSFPQIPFSDSHLQLLSQSAFRPGTDAPSKTKASGFLPTVKKRKCPFCHNSQFSAFWSRRHTKLCGENISSDCIKTVEEKELGTLPVMILPSVFSEANVLRRSIFKQEKLLACTLLLLHWKEQEELLTLTKWLQDCTCILGKTNTALGASGGLLFHLQGRVHLHRWRLSKNISHQKKSITDASWLE